MKIEIFSGRHSEEFTQTTNNWIKKHADVIIIEDIKFSSCCTSHGSIYHSVMIVYRDKPEVPEIKL